MYVPVSLIIFILIFDYTLGNDNLKSELSSLVRGRRKADSLVQTPSSNSSDSAGFVPLLLEVKELLIATKMTPEERWQKEFQAFKSEVKSDVDRIQVQLDDLSKSSNQKVDIMLQAFKGLGDIIKGKEKRLDGLLTRLNQVEEKFYDMEKSLLLKAQNNIANESIEIPVPSHLIIDTFSASVPESPQTIPLEDDLMKSHTPKSDIETFNSGHLGVISLNETLNRVKNDITLLNINLTSQSFSLSDLQKKDEKLEQVIRELQAKQPHKCSCDDNLKNLVGDITKEISDLKMNYQSIYVVINNSKNNTEQNLNLLHSEDKLLKNEISKLQASTSNLLLSNSYLDNITHEMTDMKNNIRMYLRNMAETEAYISELRHTFQQFQQGSQKRLCVWPYLQRAGSCFHVVNKDKRLSWEDARSHCKDIQGDLAAPRDLKGFSDFLTYEKLSRSYSYWIGASDVDKEEYWMWVDGRKVSMDSEVWATNQPDEGKSSNCMSLRMTSRGVAGFDDKCSSTNYFICEQER